MNTLRQAVDDYLELRRGLGFKLVNHVAAPLGAPVELFMFSILSLFKMNTI
jgi:hypothetical protein